MQSIRGSPIPHSGTLTFGLQYARLACDSLAPAIGEFARPTRSYERMHTRTTAAAEEANAARIASLTGQPEDVQLVIAAALADWLAPCHLVNLAKAGSKKNIDKSGPKYGDGQNAGGASK